MTAAVAVITVIQQVPHNHSNWVTDDNLAQITIESSFSA